MGHSTITTTAESAWNPPDTQPPEVGEYRAALEPANAGTGSRRWWNGKWWSKPYGIDWPEDVKKKYRNEPSGFSPYWLSPAQ